MERTVVTVTALKAPWPQGAAVGSTVAFAGPVPAWAAGKCTPAAGTAEPDFTYEPPVISAKPADPESSKLEAAQAQIAALLEAIPTMIETAVTAALVKAKTK